MKKQRFKNGGNDEYFTKAEIAQYCVNLCQQVIPDFNNKTIIEPSAGAGAFLDFLTNKKIIALDINPKKKGIIKKDWFSFVTKKKNCVVIGNPPFGFACSLAVKFFNHAHGIGASYICFIVPKTFRKESITNKLNSHYHLIQDTDLPKNSFLVNQQEYDVPCCFQIWEYRNKIRVIDAEVVNDILQFTTKEDAEFCIRRAGGRAGQLLDGVNHTESSTYFCKELKPGVKEAIPKINLSVVSQTAGVKSISKKELVKLIKEVMGNEN